MDKPGGYPWRLGPLDKIPREKGVLSVAKEATLPENAEARQAAALEVNVLGPEVSPQWSKGATAVKDKIARILIWSASTATRRGTSRRTASSSRGTRKQGEVHAREDLQIRGRFG